MRRRTLLASAGASGASILGTDVLSRIASGKPGKKGGVHAYTDDFTTENLGPHNLTFPMASGELIDGTLYLGTKTVSPTGIGILPLDGGQTEFREVANDEKNIWGSTSINDGNDLYFTTGFGGSKLHHFDLDENTITDVFNMGDDAHISWDVDSADGDTKVYIGSSAPSRLWEYNPSTGEGGFVYGPKLTNAQFTRSISVGAETVYAGTGKGAQLIAIDRNTEEKEVIFYASAKNSVLSNETFVYEVSSSEDYIVFGTNGTPLIGCVNKNDFTDYHVTEVPNIHPAVGSSKMQNDTIYFTAKFPGTLYKYDISVDKLTQLARLPEISNRDIFIRDGKIIGVSGSIYVWEYDISSDDLNVRNVIDSGIDGQPGAAQTASGHEGRGYIGTNSQISSHDAETESVTRFRVPGGPKSQEWVEDMLYVASYSNGDLVKYNPDTGNSEVMSSAVRSQPRGRVRPRAMHYDKNLKTLFIGTQKDEVGGGDLFAFDPGSDEVIDTYQNILGENEVVNSITSFQRGKWDTIFLGGNSLVEINPETGETLRELSLPVGGDILGLTTLDLPRPGAPETMDYIYGIAGTTLFAVDPESELLAFKKDLPGGSTGKIKSQQGLIFGEGRDKMFVCDPGTGEVSIALEDLNGEWHDRPTIGIDDSNAYLVSGTDLLKIDLPNGRGKYFNGRE